MRVTEQFALELMREAALRDCSISELVRLALHQWLHGNRTIRPSQDGG